MPHLFQQARLLRLFYIIMKEASPRPVRSHNSCALSICPADVSSAAGNASQTVSVPVTRQVFRLSRSSRPAPQRVNASDRASSKGNPIAPAAVFRWNRPCFPQMQETVSVGPLERSPNPAAAPGRLPPIRTGQKSLPTGLPERRSLPQQPFPAGEPPPCQTGPQRGRNPAAFHSNHPGLSGLRNIYPSEHLHPPCKQPALPVQPDNTGVQAIAVRLQGCVQRRRRNRTKPGRRPRCSRPFIFLPNIHQRPFPNPQRLRHPLQQTQRSLLPQFLRVQPCKPGGIQKSAQLPVCCHPCDRRQGNRLPRNPQRTVG